jgi:hypothetical protein
METNRTRAYAAHIRIAASKEQAIGDSPEKWMAQQITRHVPVIVLALK